jgi:hypothetical protein
MCREVSGPGSECRTHSQLRLLHEHGYVLIPYSVLTERYTGETPGFTQWFYRYF